MNDLVVIAGVDLAWQSDKNRSAIAIGSLGSNSLSLDSILPAVKGVEAVISALSDVDGLSGLAIDAPLIIENSSGQRFCEKEIGKHYGSRGASCHTSNTKLYPAAKSVALSKQLLGSGFTHLGDKRWQIECYPHPALIEIFGLRERLKYKKGRVSEKRAGQIELSTLLKRLADSSVLPLDLDLPKHSCFDDANILEIRGQALKTNEDALDAVVCMYIAGLYARGASGNTFGNRDDGYIWVPQVTCI